MSGTHLKGKKLGTLEEQFSKPKADKIKLQKSKKQTIWTKEKIINNLKEIIKKIGPIKRSDIKHLYHHYDICSGHVIIKNFGSLDNLALEGNIEFIKIEKWTKEKIINNLKEIIKKIGPIKRSDIKHLYHHYDICSIPTIKKQFNSIDNLALEGNIEFIKIEKWTKKKIINNLNNIIKKIGPIKRSKLNFLYQHYDICSRITIKKQFNSIDNLALEGNIEFIKIEKWTKKKIINNLKEIIKKTGLITRTNLKHLHHYYNICCEETIRKNFGSLDNLTLKSNIEFIKNDKWPKEKIINNLNKIIKKIGPITRTNLKHLHHYYDICSRATIKKQFDSFDNLALEGNIEFKIPNRRGRVGKIEKQTLDNIEKEENITLLRQFSIAGKYIDGYDRTNNIAYEVDEEHHKYQKIEDLIREDKIKAVLGCEFVRVSS